MKLFVSARSLALVCGLFLASGNISITSASMPLTAGRLDPSSHLTPMKAVPRVSPLSLSLKVRTGAASLTRSAVHPFGLSRVRPALSEMYPVLPVPVLPAFVADSVSTGLRPDHRIVEPAVLKRASQPAAFQSIDYERNSDMEEPSWLLVLGTCLLTSAAALFRKMNA